MEKGTATWNTSECPKDPPGAVRATKASEPTIAGCTAVSMPADGLKEQPTVRAAQLPDPRVLNLAIDGGGGRVDLFCSDLLA
jgi:hypothetical protein